ncbi:MAG: hypothetical protein ACREXP_06745 [Steroidobacteraceae bacterium]
MRFPAATLLLAASALASAYTPPRLEDGRPDLQGSDEQIYEDACHEGNYSLKHILEGGRVRDGTLR